MSDPALWRLRCRALAACPPLPHAGAVLRASMGAALRRRVCTDACGEHEACRRGPGCAWHARFESQEPGYRLDTSDIEERALAAWEAWELRLFTLGDPADLLRAVEDALFVGLGPDRVGHRVESVSSLIHGGPDPAEGPLDIDGRARDLVGPARVLLRTPACIRRDSQPLRRLTLDDVLHAARHRGRALDWSAPYPERATATCLGQEHLRWTRWSARQAREVPMEGVRAAWQAELDPDQAGLLAFAEVVGVGKNATMGLGTVRVESPGGTHARTWNEPPRM